MTVYIGLICLVILAWILDEKTKTNPYHNKIRISSMIILAVSFILVSSFRYRIGFDYDMYNDFFKQVCSQSFTDVVKAHWKEPSYYIFSWLVACITDNYQIWLFVSSTFIIGSIFYITYKNTDSPWISYLLYISLHIFATNMNFLRQSMAAVVLFWGYKYLKNGNTIKYLLIILLATTFHFSALIALPVYIISRLPLNKIWCSLMSAICLIGIFAIKPAINILAQFTVYSKYFNNPELQMYLGKGSIKTMILQAVIMIITLIFTQKLYKKDKKNSYIFYISLITMTITLMGINVFIIERFSIHFQLYFLIFIPQILSLYRKDIESLNTKEQNDYEKIANKSKQKQLNDTKSLITFVIICFCIFNFALGAVNGYHKAYPYVSIFNKEQAVDNNTFVSNLNK